ncbi:MAG: TniQ family protein [Chloroflexota bacterium]
MIGYFPDPYPDELFYSLCARYSERMRYPSKAAVNQELFGYRRASANVDLPRRLGFLTAALPPGHSCRDLNPLIDRHTLWPFYRPFLSVERQQAVLMAMKGRGGHNPALRAGTAGTEIPRPEWLRYCPACVAEDRRRFGEGYWHRLHQVVGVYVCPIHAVWLENSPVGVGWRRASAEFVPAEGSLHPIPARPLPLSHPWYELLLYLSRETAWLLDQPVLNMDQIALKQRYKFVLTEQGLASYTQVVKTGQLRQLFTDVGSLGISVGTTRYSGVV